MLTCLCSTDASLSGPVEVIVDSRHSLRGHHAARDRGNWRDWLSAAKGTRSSVAAYLERACWRRCKQPSGSSVMDVTERVPLRHRQIQLSLRAAAQGGARSTGHKLRSRRPVEVTTVL
jgi:hypothetical protein